MAAIAGMYLAGLVLCALAGVALRGILRPGGRWVGFETIPLGLCALIGLLYPLGAVMPGSQAGPVTLAGVVAALAVALALRARGARAAGGEGGLRLRDALLPELPETVVLAGGAILGFLMMAPILEQGFPTTVAATNNDGWGYAGLVDWLVEHPFPRDVTPSIAEPLTLIPWNTGSNGFGFGFERFAALLATVLGREGFEVVGIASAVAVAAAIGGWALLASTLRGRLTPPESALVGLGAASPLLVLPFAENYTTQFVSLCLWPVALGTFARLAAAPGWRELLVAAVATGALVGVYPSLIPWLVLPLAGVAALSPARPEWEGTRLAAIARTDARARLGRATALLAGLAVVVVVLHPIQVLRAIDNLRALDAAYVIIGDFFSAEAYAAFFVGAASGFSLFPRTPFSWATLATLGVLVVVYVLALVPWRRAGAGRLATAGMTAGILLTTGAVLVQYGINDERPYQLYKGLMSAGAVVSGLVVLGLIAGLAGRARVLSLLALGLAALWIPVSASVLEAAADGRPGFRATDVQMGRALDALPRGSTILADGAAPEQDAFQFRMMAAYFGDEAPDHTVIGVGTTGTYIAPGGLPEWRPARPWTHVLTIRSQPIATGRTRVWGNASYTLDAAPELDVATYGLGWYPPEAVGDEVWAWTSAAAELVVVNRGPARTVTLEMDAASYRRARTVTLAGGGAQAAARVGPQGLTTIALTLELPADGVVPVVLDARPGAINAPPPDGRALMVRAQAIRIR